ncbi:MAG TPA: ferritin-like domain-containing protein [Gemmatimonadales bacterium]|nr:ferritin-like domain-containing protein [Gemmatimonadales bacterium]
MPDVSLLELQRLDFYRASELHGGLILGQFARRAKDPELIQCLTVHAAEEVVHSRLWLETLLALGGRPRRQRETYQTRYAAQLGEPRTLLEVLALTNVFERRVHRHFSLHLGRPGVHPRVSQTLRRMIADERYHLAWVHRWLKHQDQLTVKRLFARYQAVDALVYAELFQEYGFAEAA